MNWRMVPARWVATIVALLLMALAPSGVALHARDADPQPDGHTDCDACHFRHLSVTTTDGAPAPYRISSRKPLFPPLRPATCTSATEADARET